MLQINGACLSSLNNPGQHQTTNLRQKGVGSDSGSTDNAVSSPYSSYLGVSHVCVTSLKLTSRTLGGYSMLLQAR